MNSIFLISVISIVICAISWIKRYDGKRLQKVMGCLIVSAFFLSVIYYVAIHASNIDIAQVLYCISLIFYNATIMFFYMYTGVYTGESRLFKIAVKVACVLQILDAVSLFVSIFTGHIIFARQISIGESILYVYEAGQYHIIHYMISLATVLLGLIRLFAATIISPKSYKSRYVNIALAVIGVLLVNILFHFLGAPIDMSGILLPIAIAVIYYYSVVFSPQRFLRDSRAVVMDEMRDGILIFDYTGEFKDANKKARILLGLDEGNVKQKVNKWIEKNGVEVMNEFVKEAFTDDSLTGSPIVQIYSYPYYEGKSGEVYSGSFVRIHDRTEEIRQNEEAMYKATHDSLTGLLNIDAFFDAAQKFLEGCEELNHYLICTNIENFKLYNTLFGIEEGDELIRNMGKALETEISGYSLMGRMNADRFCVLMPKDSFDEEEFKASYRRALENANQMSYSINTYLGIYDITSLSVPVPIMYNRTLLAAQAIKGSADKFISIYDNTITENLLELQNKIDELRLALTKEEFVFFIQPQVSKDGRVLGGEALVRWKHPEKGIVSPFFFISIMEEHGMIAALDLMVWRKVCEKLLEWKQKNIQDHYISVNISAKDFYYMNIYETFVGLAEEYGIDRKKLKLEITESAVMENEKNQIEVIQKLREAGFTVEMDDFGSGYSSLNMLNKMSVDVLKLDMGFLRKTEDDERSKTILRNIQNLAKELNMVTVAEGVETKDQADYLLSLGCDLLQGYLFSPPISVAEYEERFIENKEVFTI